MATSFCPTRITTFPQVWQKCTKGFGAVRRASLARSAWLSTTGTLVDAGEGTDTSSGAGTMRVAAGKAAGKVADTDEVRSPCVADMFTARAPACNWRVRWAAQHTARGGASASLPPVPTTKAPAAAKQWPQCDET